MLFGQLREDVNIDQLVLFALNKIVWIFFDYFKSLSFNIYIVGNIVASGDSYQKHSWLILTISFSLMTDGGGKLNVRQLQDVLKRLIVTSAFRLLPNSVRGFPFLSHLKQHMTSYRVSIQYFKSVLLTRKDYNLLHKRTNGVIIWFENNAFVSA